MKNYFTLTGVSSSKIKFIFLFFSETQIILDSSSRSKVKLFRCLINDFLEFSNFRPRRLFSGANFDRCIRVQRIAHVVALLFSQEIKSSFLQGFRETLTPSVLAPGRTPTPMGVGFRVTHFLFRSGFRFSGVFVAITFSARIQFSWVAGPTPSVFS